MSNTIRLSTDTLSGIQSQLKKLQSDIASYSGSVRSIAADMSRASGAYVQVQMNMKLSVNATISGGDIKSVLSKLNRALSACSSETARLSSAVSNAGSLVDDTEGSLVEYINGIGTGDQASFQGGGNKDATTQTAPIAGTDGIDWRWDELIKSIITSMGSAGEFFYSLITATTSPAGLIKFLVQGRHCVAEWAEMIPKFKKLQRFSPDYAVKTYAKKLLGLTSYASSMGFTPSQAGSFLRKFTSNLTRSGAFLKGLKNPVTWILEGIDKGIENWNEFTGGYKDGGTAVAEWVSETAVTVAVGAGAVAVVGAAIPTAPILAVGLIAGVAVWGVDTLWANTIGRGADEDGGNEGLLETVGEGIVQGGKWVVEKASSAISDLGHSLSEEISGA